MSGDYDRKSDEVLHKLVQKMEDFVNDTEAWQRDHDNTSREWRESLDDRLKPVEAFVQNAHWSWKIILFVVAVVAALAKTFDWVKDHLRP